MPTNTANDELDIPPVLDRRKKPPATATEPTEVASGEPSTGEARQSVEQSVELVAQASESLPRLIEQAAAALNSAVTAAESRSG
jgi:hypothetical protein